MVDFTAESVFYSMQKAKVTFRSVVCRFMIFHDKVKVTFFRRHPLGNRPKSVQTHNIEVMACRRNGLSDFLKYHIPYVLSEFPSSEVDMYVNALKGLLMTSHMSVSEAKPRSPTRRGPSHQIVSFPSELWLL